MKGRRWFPWDWWALLVVLCVLLALLGGLVWDSLTLLL